MSKIKYGVLDVKAALERTVALEPNRQDMRVLNGHGPRYLHHGEPSCLGAYLLLELGLSRQMLKNLDNQGAIIVGAGPFHKRFTIPAWELVKFVQARNDRGWRWRDVLHEAFNTDPGYGFQSRVYHPNCSFWRERPWLEKPTGEALEYAYRYGVGSAC